MYAKTLSIYDFKSLGTAILKFQYPGRRGKGVSELKNVNLILGDNGGGKSSVLRALAIAALAPALLDSGFVPFRLVRRPKSNETKSIDRSLLKLEVVIGKNERLDNFDRKKNELLARIDRGPSRRDVDRLHMDRTPRSPIAKALYDETSPTFFVAGYGATRRVETGDFSPSSARKLRGLRYQRIAGLFEDHFALRPLQAWLPRLQAKNPKRYNACISLLNSTLPNNIAFSGAVDYNDQYNFLFDGALTPFSSLSDGYKAFIGWVGDLIGHLADVAPEGAKIDALPGVVLVDEIDLHLHPEWQRSVVPKLASVFPCLQFVFTSHSPLIASTVRRENVFLTDVTDENIATVKQIEEFVHGRSAEQLLLSPYFGLTTTRPVGFQVEARNLFESAADGNSNAALEYLARLSGASRASDATFVPSQKARSTKKPVARRR